MQNLVPNDGPGAKFALWTPTVTGSATVPVGTYSATSGPDSQPGLTLSATGTSGGIEAVATVNVEQESALGISVTCAASSATPTLIPIAVTFKDVNGNTILTDTPIASAAAPTAATEYNAVVNVPDGAVKAVVALAALAWSSTGGYTVAMSSPEVLAY